MPGKRQRTDQSADDNLISESIESATLTRLTSPQGSHRYGIMNPAFLEDGGTISSQLCYSPASTLPRSTRSHPLSAQPLHPYHPQPMHCMSSHGPTSRTGSLGRHSSLGWREYGIDDRFTESWLELQNAYSLGSSGSGSRSKRSNCCRKCCKWSIKFFAWLLVVCSLAGILAIIAGIIWLETYKPIDEWRRSANETLSNLTINVPDSLSATLSASTPTTKEAFSTSTMPSVTTLAATTLLTITESLERRGSLSPITSISASSSSYPPTTKDSTSGVTTATTAPTLDEKTLNTSRSPFHSNSSAFQSSASSSKPVESVSISSQTVTPPSTLASSILTLLPSSSRSSTTATSSSPFAIMNTMNTTASSSVISATRGSTDKASANNSQGSHIDSAVSETPKTSKGAGRSGRRNEDVATADEEESPSSPSPHETTFAPVSATQHPNQARSARGMSSVQLQDGQNEASSNKDKVTTDAAPAAALTDSINMAESGEALSGLTTVTESDRSSGSSSSRVDTTEAPLSLVTSQQTGTVLSEADTHSAALVNGDEIVLSGRRQKEEEKSISKPAKNNEAENANDVSQTTTMASVEQQPAVTSASLQEDDTTTSLPQ